VSELSLTKIGLRAGVWQGRLIGPSAAQVEVRHGDVTLDIEIQPDGDNAWVLSVPMPPGLLGEGINTFLIRDRDTGGEIGGFAIAIAECGDDDLRADLKLLRAELDLLKQAFRRHVSDG
jgi:hypothetical protein